MAGAGLQVREAVRGVAWQAWLAEAQKGRGAGSQALLFASSTVSCLMSCGRYDTAHTRATRALGR